MSRDTTNEVKSFSVFFLKKHGKLGTDVSWSGGSINWSCRGEPTGRIEYTLSVGEEESSINLDYKTKRFGDTEWTPIKYKIPLVKVKCNFGGVRWYFQCPFTTNGRYCGKRVAVLYQSGDYFTCRHCANLTYESCNEGKRFRSWPWNLLSNSWKSEEMFEQIKRTHYAGKPTRKYRSYLKKFGNLEDVYKAELAMYKEL